MKGKQPVVFVPDVAVELSRALAALDYDRLFVLTDETTNRLCLPLLKECARVADATHIVIKPTDTHKNVESLSQVWRSLGEGRGSRRSLMVNLGGGMVTDLGGFAASTFKRGIRFINIPTTLLAMVDASVGGKTGINFGGLKNEVGVFSDALEVIIDTRFLETLDDANLRSGFAEMVKHALISDENHWSELLGYDLNNPDLQRLAILLQKSVAVKENIVLQDPMEKGVRKALNVGHTAGHAFESYAMATGQPVLHGYAVAWGMISELYLSVTKMGFPTYKMRQTVNFLRQHYGTLPFDCKSYDQLYQLMTHDKKNTLGFINFTLLSDIGKIELNQSAGKEEIFQMLDFYREQF